MDMQPTQEHEHEVVEVEAERMPADETEQEEQLREVKERFKRGFGPVFAGIVLDVVDFGTFSMPGLVLGAIAGLWLARYLGFKTKYALIASVASGIYCMFPPTRFFPFATLLGAVAPLFIDERMKSANAKQSGSRPRNS